MIPRYKVKVAKVILLKSKHTRLYTFLLDQVQEVGKVFSPFCSLICWRLQGELVRQALRKLPCRMNMKRQWRGEDMQECSLFTLHFNPLPNDNILDVTKLKAFADDKLNVARMMNSLLDREENTVGKGENAGYQHFLLFTQCFPKPSSLGSLTVGLCG